MMKNLRKLQVSAAVALPLAVGKFITIELVSGNGIAGKVELDD